MTLALQKSMERIVIDATGLDEKIFRDFQFEVGTTPLSNVYFPATTVALYCIGIPLLQRFMRDRKSPPLRWLLVAHNIFLSFVSAFMAIFLFATVFSFYTDKGYTLLEVYCGIPQVQQHGTLTLIYYFNHFLKYYELLDTVFLVLKHKPVSFLHGYHHPATLVLTWATLVDSLGVQWVVIFLNLCVHTVMYWYYLMAALKIRMPGKILITLFQITQFILDLAACYIAWAMWETNQLCVGTKRGAIIGCFILTSYLYLFLDFFKEKYTNCGKKASKPVNDKPIAIERMEKK